MKASFIDCADLQLPGMSVSARCYRFSYAAAKALERWGRDYPAVQLRDNNFGAFIPLFQFLRRLHRGT
jgi:hypothetical protein